MTRARISGVVCALAVLATACSYKTLTFFFDGVPPPASAAVQSRAPAAASEVRSSPVGSLHGPYAAKQCDGCHVSGSSNALVVPADKLCARCHALALDKKFVHGPVVAGGCLVCHDPHSSAQPFLLVGESGNFCLSCHDIRSLGPVEGHVENGPGCTTCHEAHMSDRRFLLR
jgi:predicted CXXCH cytochrome family protein